MEATWSYDLRVRCLCPCTRIARKMDRKLIRYQTDGFPDPLSAIYFTNVCSLFEEKIVRHPDDFEGFCSFQAFSVLLARIIHSFFLLIGNQVRLSFHLYLHCRFHLTLLDRKLVKIALILYYIGIFLFCFSFFVLLRFENKIMEKNIVEEIRNKVAIKYFPMSVSFNNYNY